MRDIPYQGMHDFVGRTIELDDEIGTEQTLARLVVAHELGHALHVPHMPCPSIMCGRHGKGEALIGLSKAEVRAARPVWETRVRCDPSCNQTIREAVDWAILQWNVKIGGTAFVRDTP